MAEDPRTKAKQLMALALRTDFDQEARTAALKAVRLIDKHDMLAQVPAPASRVRSIQSDYDARAEIARLREQIEELRMERRMQAPVPTPSPSRPKALPPTGYTSFALIDLAAHMREIDQLKREVARLQGSPRPVAFHVVRPGETPTSITQAYTGDPTRFHELVMANPQKSSYLTPAGARTFVALVVGERLQLPASWGR